MEITEKWRLAHAGTVSHGTHRTPDLLRAFGEKYHELEPNDMHLYGECVAYAAILDGDDCEANTTLAQMVLEEVTDKLNEHAPEGWYFGSHPGDGSDFGFWVEEN